MTRSPAASGPFLLACALALSTLLAPPAASATLHVSTEGNDRWSGRHEAPLADRSDGPLRTLAGARDAVRRLKRAEGLREPVRVLIHAGTYRITEPIVFGPDDSGTREAPITYAGEPGARAVLSGGRVITSWHREGELWVAEVPEVKSGQWTFSALWVDGERRPRARHPNEGYLHTAGKAAPAKDPATGAEVPRESTAFRFRPGDIQAWRNLADACVVVYHSWETSLHRIARIEEADSTVVFTGPAKWPFERWRTQQRYHVENVREALDAPGEWYLDRSSGVLAYFPRPGEDLARAEVVVPVTRQLVVLAGDPAAARFVEHLRFEDLRFLHSDWTAPAEGHSDSQAAASIPGAFEARGARHVSLRRCEVAHTGTYGVWLRAGVKDSLVEECHVHDLGAGGVRIGEVASPASDAEAAERNTVHNSFIHDGGKILASGVGVWIGRSSHNRISHNEISDFYYTGVSVGWSWGYAPSTAHDNVIEHNHIHDLGRGVLDDLGGIYTLGVSPGTVERQNLIHDVYSHSFGGWGIYTDEGSTEILIEKNIVYNTASGCFHQHYGKENVLRNNVFAFGREGVLRRSREEDHVSFTLERNLVLSDGSPFHITTWSNGNYRIDSNLYWDYRNAQPSFAGMSFAEWQAKGRDARSVVADPLCAGALAFDFRLQPGSPAAAIGFEPIDTADIGLRGETSWRELPKRLPPRVPRR